MSKARNPKVRCQYFKLVDPKRLKPHPKNPNRHTDEQIEIYGEIIEASGWRRAIVVSTLSGCVVTGHGALMAAKLRGWTEVPVDYQNFDTKAQELAHLVADNQLARWSTDDRRALAAVVEEVRDDGVDAALLALASYGKKTKAKAEVKEVIFSEVIMEENNYVVLIFRNQIDWLAAKTHFQLGTRYSTRTTGKPWSAGIGRVIDGAEYLGRMNATI